MKDAVALMKKRTALEEKVVNIGMDNNLIKNLAQLLPSFSQQTQWSIIFVFLYLLKNFYHCYSSKQL